LLNDLWVYYIKRNKWLYIKPDYNRDETKDLLVPTARFGHSGSYVELEDSKTVLPSTNNQRLLRKYLYVYGGFSFACTTACFDTWRYEISYGP